jgi:glycine betaine/proline transport system permease protein
MPTIMAGVNQTIMLALSMVVIAAMIGAKGLGGEVWKAIQRLKPGMGFVAGLAVVLLAMILDRITQNIANKNQQDS